MSAASAEARRLCEAAGDADRKTPEWAKPLAPLPEWLESVTRLLEEIPHRDLEEIPPQDPDWWTASVRRPAGYRAPTSPAAGAAGTREPWRRPSTRAEWMMQWRTRLGLTQDEAAQALGYRTDQIRRLEAGEVIRGSHKLQRLLAEARRPGAFPDRIYWLIEWRRRLEISQKVAARRLGYSSRSSVSDVERGLRRPSWEKILIAIVEEEQGSGSERCET